MDGFLLHNASGSMLTFTVAGDGNPSWRLPPWLDLIPTSAVMMPGSNVMVKVRA